MKTLSTILKICAVGAAVAALGGCAAAGVMVGGATTTAVAADERTAGAFVEDQGIELKAWNRLRNEFGDDVNVDLISYNRRVLLIGQAPSEQLRQQVVRLVEDIDNVKEVIDYLQVSGTESLLDKANNAALTTRVKTALCRVQDEGFSCLDVKVVTDSGTVYLLGLVSKSQGAIAVKAVRNISGVRKVVKVFEYIPE